MEQFAGFALGILAAILLLQFAQGGTKQVRQWLAAKFLGQPS
ncbi:MAG TPA: hypothetical protein VG348_15890 [Acidimicrobiia bacterium]|jgi:hypothetical protein|nr:hypothetical protein [Acidimicrobiia bacterium]